MKKVFAVAKVILLAGLVCVFIGVYLVRKTDIHSFIESLINSHKEVELGDVNDYYRDYGFLYATNTDNFEPENYQDIINIFYTILNAGKEEFTFYCPKHYEGCIEDIQKFANDQSLLSDINNFVHPYNGFSHIETEYDTLGQVTIHVTHSYTEDEMEQINAKVNELASQLINPSRAARDNIQAVHDYIINTTRYDSLKSEQNIDRYQSDIAYGPLFEGYGVCGGYTDLMALFLEKMGLINYKVSSSKHIWNAVLIEGNWYHLDLTWDDPVADDGGDYLEYNYFLVPTYLLTPDEQHNYDPNVYLELK